jgi:hypothetical protein
MNIVEKNSLKNIEEYNELLLKLSKSKVQTNRILVNGIIQKFEEYLNNNVELKAQYNKFVTDKNLQKKFNSYNELKILSLISIIYVSNIEKSNDKTDLILSKCYFLINKCRNIALAIWLCTNIKKCTHIQSYYKYVLMEEIKDYLSSKLVKNKKKLNLKNIQISSVILFNKYKELFKIKIYDAACNQMDYFDILRNNKTSANTTQIFLKIGEEILSLKEDIFNIWEKIMILNPFSKESIKDFMIYLDTILQDVNLMKIEQKKYYELNKEKKSEKNNVY